LKSEETRGEEETQEKGCRGEREGGERKDTEER